MYLLTVEHVEIDMMLFVFFIGVVKETASSKPRVSPHGAGCVPMKEWCRPMRAWASVKGGRGGRGGGKSKTRSPIWGAGELAWLFSVFVFL